MLKTLRGKRLGRSFFDQSTVKVAQELLGKYLIINQAIPFGDTFPKGLRPSGGTSTGGDCHPMKETRLFPSNSLIRIGTSQIPMLQNERFQIGQIIETEAYVGEKDKACHASRGCTPRNKIMWEQAGMLYVYLIYGMYHCLNIVTEQAGFPAAVLIRGLEPISGISGEVDGPGKLCRELGITTKYTGIDITESNKIYINDIDEEPKRVIVAERVGVDYAGEWARKKWRFLSE